MIFDYVKEYGSETFAHEPLNYLDLLVFTGLAYFDFPGECLGRRLPEAIPLAHEPMIDAADGNGRIVAMRDEGDGMLADLVCNAPRYKKVIVEAFENKYIEDKQQFAALALMLGDTLIVIFRGTDETVTGWEEALKLSLDEPVLSQKDAVRFLGQQARRSGGPIIVCGHSKGGNLAEYAATLCAGSDSGIADRIASVVSFDGPGLPPHLRETEGYRAIASRIRTFIPKSSIIGNIHEHPDGAVEIIDSNKAFLAQHLIFNWKTRGTHFVPARPTLAGRLGSGALSGLINNLNDKQKNSIFRAIFAIPKARGQQLLK